MADTPVILQYREIKEKYPDTVLFFRLGDFYEMFGSDAVDISNTLSLTLTHKGDEPMCGIPYHAASVYIKRLLEAGRKIAVCEQMEAPSSSSKIVRREVVKVLSPATVIEDDFLDNLSGNFILCFFMHSCAYCDVSTGSFHLRPLNRTTRTEDMKAVINTVNPKEILVCEDEYFMDSSFRAVVDSSSAMITKLAPWFFKAKDSYAFMCENAGCVSLASFALEKTDEVIKPAGALLRYVKESSKLSVAHITDYVLDKPGNLVEIDSASRKNLELFKSLSDGSSNNTLFSSLNKCRTSGGTRLLKAFIASPVKEKQEIERRQNFVKRLFENKEERERIRSILYGVSDVRRIVTRIFLKRCDPHDLVSLSGSVVSFFEIMSEDTDFYLSLLEGDVDFEAMKELAMELGKAIDASYLGLYRPGEVIKSGYDSILDNLRNEKNNADSILDSYLEEEKSANGISILKIGFNNIYGYYIEVPKGQLSKVPSYFIRRQTLVNAERFTTEKLKGFEDSILSADSKANEREKELYDALVTRASSLKSSFDTVASFLDNLDVFQSFATVAYEKNYVCPVLNESGDFEITDGRHPVVEDNIGFASFVPNSLDFKTRFCLITGPNMAGKSTFLRQNALIVLLAHIGSFVPAKKAVIPVTDKIFCRVGASDNLAKGESTFLVEMQETAFILRNCTKDSFVIVDEIGRGTSTQDGLSIAYAVMNKLIEINCRTLFATHYHELTYTDVSRLRLLTLDVEETPKGVRFLRNVKEGRATSSYGLHVAGMAGVPADVVKNAKSFQKRYFADYNPFNDNSLFTVSEDSDSFVSGDAAQKYDELVSRILAVNVDEITPMQALFALSSIQEDLKK